MTVVQPFRMVINEAEMASLAELRQKLQTVPKFKSCLDEEFLLRFLRVRRLDVDAAQKLIVSYYRFLRDNAKLISKLEPSLVRYIYSTNALSILPYKDQKKRTILVVSACQWNPSEVDIVRFAVAYMHLLEYALRDENAQRNGVVFIVDMKDFKTWNARYITLGNLRLLTHFCQKCCPGRITGIHIVNEMGICRYFFRLLTPFMHPKVIKRVHFHGYDISSLHKHVPVEILPPSLGGKVNPKDSVAILEELCGPTGDLFASSKIFGFRD